MRVILLAACVAALSGPALAQSAGPQRVPLTVIPIAPAKPVSRVETTQVLFPPGQAIGRHKHTVPVVCFVTSGAFVFRIGDAPEGRVEAGGVTFEPAETVVHYFRNASASEPGTLNCALLAGKDDHDLTVMLPPE